VKNCSKCKKLKPFDSFFTRTIGSRDGLQSSCKDCHKLKTYKWRLKNKNKWLSYVKQRYYKDRASGHWHELRSTHPARRAMYRRKMRYGITEKQFLNFLKKQSYKCAICKKSLKNNIKLFCVDHCHKTQFIRGLLCGPCNWGIGSFRDNVNRLKKAVNYLKRAEDRQRKKLAEGKVA
jgi:hypothetical protein